ncbi:MAG: RHS repeat domain-containing protein, partial [Pyrinomonadaceae bacterium]
VYDALGNRVASKVNDVWRFSIYDAFGKLVAEYGQADEGAGGVSYIQQDSQGSVRTVSNSNGFVISRTDHTAFGESIPNGTGLRSTTQGYWGTVATRQGYGLTERDEATGLDHTWFRKNEGSAGRWTSPDPYNGSIDIDDPQSFNRYSYVGNQPTNFVDPSGLDDDIPEEPGVITIDTWTWRWRSGGGGGGGHLTIEDLPLNETGGDPGGGGGCTNVAARGQVRPPPPRRPVNNQSANNRRRANSSARNGRQSARAPYPRGAPPSISRPDYQGAYGDHLNPRWGYSERSVVTWSSFSGFKRALGNASTGNQWHHVVEQGQTQFGGARLNSPGNLIQIPSALHTRISAHFSSIRPGTGQTVRQWLRGQSFEQQHAYGMQVLRDLGAIPCAQ